MSSNPAAPAESGPFRLLTELVARAALRRRLAPREVQVLQLCATGLDSKEIASRLGCSPKTVDEHWRRIYLKWGMRSRHRIVAESLAEALGELPVSNASGTAPLAPPKLNPSSPTLSSAQSVRMQKQKAQPTNVGRAFR